MENKPTDSEILKALEYCSQQGSMSECERCKIKRGCRFELIKLAFDLINRLQAEKEALINGQETLQKYIAEQKAEIERLQNSIAVFTNNAVDFANEIDRHKKDKEEAFLFAANIVESEKIVIANAKSEAYKEFAEDIKATKITHKIFGEIVFVEDIDNLLKELGVIVNETIL